MEKYELGQRFNFTESWILLLQLDTLQCKRWLDSGKRKQWKKSFWHMIWKRVQPR